MDDYIKVKLLKKGANDESKGEKKWMSITLFVRVVLVAILLLIIFAIPVEVG